MHVYLVYGRLMVLWVHLIHACARDCVSHLTLHFVVCFASCRATCILFTAIFTSVLVQCSSFLFIVHSNLHVNHGVCPMLILLIIVHNNILGTSSCSYFMFVLCITTCMCTQLHICACPMFPIVTIVHSNMLVIHSHASHLCLSNVLRVHCA